MGEFKVGKKRGREKKLYSRSNYKRSSGRGQEDVFRKIKKDFQAASITVEETEIKDQMEKALSRAKEDFKK